LLAVLRRDGHAPAAVPGNFAGDALAGLGAGAAELGVELGHLACDDALVRRLAGDPAHLAARLGRRPDGLVLWGWGEEPALPVLAVEWPCASLSPLPRPLPVVQLNIDHAQAVGVLLDHLLELGHRDIGFLCRNHPDGRGSERLGAYVGACHLRGCAWDQRRLVTCAGDGGDGARLAAATRAGVRAWIADSQFLGEDAWRWLTAAGLAVPGDCSLASFTAAPPSPGCPLMTRVRGPFAAIGRLAVGLLLSPWDRSRPACRVQLAVELEPGTTTAPPPAR
ncbi:MAG: substrate-binding domain-containing protein, partial [Planctomycetes bacterium]|nr:substrate-binding domain-containing protein [Planctomycetota bacterium]